MAASGAGAIIGADSTPGSRAVDRIKVLVTHHAAKPQDILMIGAVDPRVDAVYALHRDAFVRNHIEASRRANSPLDMPESADFDEEVGEAQAIFSLGLPVDILDRAPRLRWVQGLGAGVDYYERSGLFNSRVTITNSGGVNARAIAEFVALLMLQHVKNFRDRLQAQREHRWSRYINDELRGTTVGIIGAGHIAQAVAHLAKAFGMRVLATRRNFAAGQALPNFDELFPAGRLHGMLGQSDWVVAAMNLSSETRRMLGEAEFRAMKPGAYFINVARGGVVDQDALLRALTAGHLGGAALDVFDPEPMPPDEAFWDLPNVVITAHNSGGLRDLSARSTALFCENLRRFIDGEPLANVVSPANEGA